MAVSSAWRGSGEVDQRLGTNQTVMDEGYKQWNGEEEEKQGNIKQTKEEREGDMSKGERKRGRRERGKHLPSSPNSHTSVAESLTKEANILYLKRRKSFSRPVKDLQSLRILAYCVLWINEWSSYLFILILFPLVEGHSFLIWLSHVLPFDWVACSSSLV